RACSACIPAARSPADAALPPIPADSRRSARALRRPCLDDGAACAPARRAPPPAPPAPRRSADDPVGCGPRGGAQGQDVTEDGIGDGPLGHAGQTSLATPAIDQQHLVVVGVEADPRLTDVVGDEQIDALALEL